MAYSSPYIAIEYKMGKAGFFFHNLFTSIGLLKNTGLLAGFPVDGDQPLPMVHLNDIAEVAA